jgi:hypothetical protein
MDDYFDDEYEMLANEGVGQEMPTYEMPAEEMEGENLPRARRRRRCRCGCKVNIFIVPAEMASAMPRKPAEEGNDPPTGRWGRHFLRGPWQRC